MYLNMLLRDFGKEVARLRVQFRADPWPALPGGHWSQSGGAAYSVVRLLDAWNRFCRQLVLVSARGNIVTLSGTIVNRSPVLKPGQVALDALKATYPSTRQRWYLWEPKWFDPRESIDAGTRLQIQNLQSVTLGLGLSQTIPGLQIDAPDDLRKCRNYLAHRSKLTFDELADLRRRLRVAQRLRANQLPFVVLPGGGTPFESWCADLMIRAQTAVG